jgi:general stress protein YciG
LTYLHYYSANRQLGGEWEQEKARAKEEEDAKEDGEWQGWKSLSPHSQQKDGEEKTNKGRKDGQNVEQGGSTNEHRVENEITQSKLDTTL